MYDFNIFVNYSLYLLPTIYVLYNGRNNIFFYSYLYLRIAKEKQVKK